MNPISILIWAAVVLFEYQRKRESVWTTVKVGVVSGIVSTLYMMYFSEQLLNFMVLTPVMQITWAVVLILSMVLFALFDFVMQKLVANFNDRSILEFALMTAILASVQMVMTNLMAGVSIVPMDVAIPAVMAGVVVLAAVYTRAWEMLSSKVSFLQ